MLKAPKYSFVAGGGRAGHASAFATGQLINFHRQFGNCVFADGNGSCTGITTSSSRRESMFSTSIPWTSRCGRLSADSTLIFETETDQDASRFRPHWREWNIVTAERGMAALADAVGHIRPLYNDSRRCHGFCAEEQTVLQFESRGFHLTPLPWNMTLHRIYMKVPGESDEQLTARLSTVGFRVLASTSGPRATFEGERKTSWQGRYLCDAGVGRYEATWMAEGFYGTRLRLIY